MTGSDNTKKKTIGFLTRAMPHQTGLNAWRGIVKRANALGVNLITFFCEAIGDQRDFNYQANVLYDMLSRQRLDGVIVWTAMIDLYVSRETLELFFKRFAAFPVISCEVVIPDVHAVTMNDYSGMRDMVEHLVRHHGRQRIAFLRGPNGHIGLQDRFRAYKDVLQENALALDDRLISPPCNFYIEDASRLVFSLLDSGAWQGLDALVAPSESLALGALFALQNRGLNVPEDVALVSYDDTEVIAASTPPISTIYAPLYEIVCTSIEHLLQLLDGVPQALITEVPTRLVIRKSCGCKEPPSAMHQLVHNQERLRPTTPDSSDCLLDQLAPLKKALFALGSQQIGRHSTERLAQHYLQALVQPDPQAASQYLYELEAVVTQLQAAGQSLDEAQAVVDFTWRFLEEACGGSEAAIANTYLHDQARKLLLVSAQQATITDLRSTRYRLDNETKKLRALGNLLLTTSSKADLFDVLVASFADIGVAQCYVAAFDGAQTTTAHLQLAYNNGRRQDVTQMPAFASPLLVPDAVFASLPSLNWLVQSLHFREQKMGYLILDTANIPDGGFEILRSMISSALQTEMLREIVQQSVGSLRAAQAQLVISEKMALLGSLVSGVAHELNTPLGIGITMASSLEHLIADMAAKLETRELSYKAFDQWIGSLREGMALIYSSLERASKFVEDFKQISIDQTSDAMRSFGVLDYINEIVATIASEISTHGHMVRVHCAEGLRIASYPGAVGQILAHLMRNSLKHGLRDIQGGTMEIRVEVTPEQGISLHYMDTGLGVRPSELPRIFEPFRTSLRNTGGSGLGTYVIYTLVTQKLKGTVSASCAEGQGLAYRIDFTPDAIEL
jgi:DNA-binding LacI/PurR family transcriptional regulator/signal transduction histidine kinase